MSNSSVGSIAHEDDNYPEDTGQTLAEWLVEWGKMEMGRIVRAQANFSKWLASQDTSKWTITTPEQWARRWTPNEVE